MPGNKDVDLSPVIFIAGEAFVNLRSGQLREAVYPHRVNGLAVLKQSDDVMNGSSGTFHCGVPAPHASGTDDVTTGFRNRGQT